MVWGVLEDIIMVVQAQELEVVCAGRLAGRCARLQQWTRGLLVDVAATCGLQQR